MEALKERIDSGEKRGKSVGESAGNRVGGKEEEEKKSCEEEISEGEGFVERKSPVVPNFAENKHEIIILPEGGEEIGAVAERIAEVDRVHRQTLVGNARAAVQVPAELLVPHQRREVHEVVEPTHVFATLEGKCRRYEESSASPSSNSGAAWLSSYSSVE